MTYPVDPITAPTQTPINADDEKYFTYNQDCLVTITAVTWTAGFLYSGVAKDGTVTFNPDPTVNINGTTANKICPKGYSFTMTNPTGGLAWELTLYKKVIAEDVAFTYDGGGNITDIVSDSSVVAVAYDGAGNVDTMTDSLTGLVHTFNYTGDDLISVTVA